MTSLRRHRDEAAYLIRVSRISIEDGRAVGDVGLRVGVGPNPRLSVADQGSHRDRDRQGPEIKVASTDTD